MSKLITLRNNTTLYVTNAQADQIFEEVNNNPNLRMLRVITGQGFQYFQPSSIVAMTPCLGEGYKSDAQLEAENERALRRADGRLGSGNVGHMLGNGE